MMGVQDNRYLCYLQKKIIIGDFATSTDVDRTITMFSPQGFSKEERENIF